VTERSCYLTTRPSVAATLP